MSLDLHDVMSDWNCPPGEISARLVRGSDGTPLVQLRLDLGIMQMEVEGRPDGRRPHGRPTIFEYIRSELRLGHDGVSEEEWRELDREIHQINYRRLALTSLAEEALGRNDVSTAGDYLKRALEDINFCLEALCFAAETQSSISQTTLALRPTLTFQRGRLTVQRFILLEAYEEAIEHALQGAQALRELLAELGLDEAQCEEDPGIQHLLMIAGHLREEYEIPETIRERLARAVAEDDFETAAMLRDVLQKREAQRRAGD